jgi:hypothetical protein
MKHHPRILSALGLSSLAIERMSDPSRVRLLVEPTSGANAGPTLADLRTQLGGADEGTMADPWFGIEHVVDLSRWRDLPPDTRFVVRFTYDTNDDAATRSNDAIRVLLLAAVPDDEATACTFEELLGRRVTVESVPSEPDPESERTETTLREAMNTNRKWTKARVRATLTLMVREGIILRVSRGRREPFRYWREQLL